MNESVNDLVSILDKKAALRPVRCPNEGRAAVLPQSGARDTRHGAMQVHASGAYLVCGMCDEKAGVAMLNE